MKEIALNIDFKDAYYRSCEADDESLIVYITSWDEKTLRLEFSNVLSFIVRSGSVVSGLYEDRNQTPFLMNALSAHYEEIPQNYPFKVFLLIDIDDQALFEVIAEKVSVTKS